MRASDSDRDAVVSDLSENFQAGRLTAAEFDQRMERALAARTWGELRELQADLPATRPAPQAPAAASSGTPPQPSRGSFAPPAIAALAAVAITAAVLVNVTHGGWGFIWLPLAVLFIARRLIGRSRGSGCCEPEN
jgi:ferric-dicitrate binding protein FerR (iron transport regulator)